MPRTSTLRILLVDEHPMFREGLRGVVEECAGYQVLAEAGSVAEAEEKFKLVTPDAVITDLVFEGLINHELISDWADRSRVLVMSSETSKWEVLGAIEAGASGYITKSATREQVLAALHELKAGRNYLHPEVAHVVFEKLRSNNAPAHQISLTSRESELLDLLGRGCSPQAIAAQLHLAPSTIKTHVRNLFRKFEVTSRTQLILKAIKLELIAVRPQQPV